MVRDKSTIPNSFALTCWYKSSYSGGDQGECLEVARGRADVPVRDSKTVPGPAVLFSANGWAAFVTAVKKSQLSPTQ